MHQPITRKPRPVSIMVALYLTVLIVVLFIASSDRFLHWFVVPVAACGVLTGADAIDWFRGRLDRFDPVGVLGLLGVHFFFLAPLLHVKWDYWMKGVAGPDDWRTWLGLMAILNLLGLALYRIVLRTNLGQRHATMQHWTIEGRRFWPLLGLGLVVAGGLQLLVYRSYGGLAGYIDTFSTNVSAFAGMGFTFLVSESFPILCILGWAYYIRSRNRAVSWLTVWMVVACFFAVRILFGGLRGSRSNTVWALFWAIGIIHYWVKPVPKKAIAIGMTLLLGFMYIYGFYKGVGSEALQIASGSSSLADLEQKTGRTMDGVLLGDLGRADVQSFILYRLLASDRDYSLAWGRTYAGAATLLIPKSLWPGRPETKVREGTEIQYGAGSYSAAWWSSRIYGLSGEAMLNFGVLGAPLTLGALGLIVHRLRDAMASLPADDSRWLLVPLLILLSFWCLVSDSDNLVFVAVKNGAIPFLTILLSSRITRVPTNTTTGMTR